MGLFRKRKEKVLDLSERYRKQQERTAQMPEDEQVVSQTPSGGNAGGLGFFGAIANTVSDQDQVESTPIVPGDADEKRRKLSKKLMDITNKMEELSNQIYHLQQRIEVLEKKGGVGSY